MEEMIDLARDSLEKARYYLYSECRPRSFIALFLKDIYGMRQEYD